TCGKFRDSNQWDLSILIREMLWKNAQQQQIVGEDLLARTHPQEHRYWSETGIKSVKSLVTG
ncbi:hypothetical protein AVEN_174483-1, partial [Araneus ventricosus]